MCKFRKNKFVELVREYFFFRWEFSTNNRTHKL